MTATAERKLTFSIEPKAFAETRYAVAGTTGIKSFAPASIKSDNHEFRTKAATIHSAWFAFLAQSPQRLLLPLGSMHESQPYWLQKHLSWISEYQQASLHAPSSPPLPSSALALSCSEPLAIPKMQ
jgi:hypothetical protein